MSDEQCRVNSTGVNSVGVNSAIRVMHVRRDDIPSEVCRMYSVRMNSTPGEQFHRVNSTARHTWVSQENPPTLGTRGYIPDISPRGYVGLGEACIVLPKIGIAELVLKI